MGAKAEQDSIEAAASGFAPPSMGTEGVELEMGSDDDEAGLMVNVHV